MVRLLTRLDKDTQAVFWRMEDSEEEYKYLPDLLKVYSLNFDSTSTVMVKIVTPGRTLAKIVYSVMYDMDTNTIQLNGLLGLFKGEIYDTFTRFGNEHIGFAETYDASAKFHKRYRALPDSIDSSSDYSNPGSDSESVY